MCRAVSPSQVPPQVRRAREAAGDAGGDATQASGAVHSRGQLWLGSASCARRGRRMLRPLGLLSPAAALEEAVRC